MSTGLSSDWWNTQSAVYAQVVAKAWSDDAFRTHLLSNSREALAQHGVSFPDGFNVKVVPGGTGTTLELPLPDRPAGLGEHSYDASDHDSSKCCCCC